nr:hypothetical protein CFP56_47677 [Quercus suber]
MVVTNQCPISKTQCEQLLAFLNSGSTNSGAGFGDASHAASVSSCMYTGVEGLTGMASDVVGTSASPNLNTNAAFMSASDFTDPFILGVDTTTEGDLGTFVTPVSIPDVPLDSSKSFPISTHPCVTEPISDSSPYDVLSNDSISFNKYASMKLALNVRGSCRAVCIRGQLSMHHRSREACN